MIMLRGASMALTGAAIAYAFGAFIAWSLWPGDWWLVWRWMIGTAAAVFAFIGWVQA